jgi:hypothetical protein
MIAYQYDSETKKYIGEIDRQIDPLESQAQGKEIWLMPADSTDIVPPEAKDGYDIVFVARSKIFRKKSYDVANIMKKHFISAGMWNTNDK